MLVIEQHRALNRRSFLAASATLIAASCSGSADSQTATDAPTDSLDPALRQLGVRFPDGFGAPTIFVAGTPIRAPYVPIESDGFPIRVGEPAEITMTVRFNGEVVFDEAVPKRRSGQSTPFYTLAFTPEEPGTYQVSSSWSTTPRDFLVSDGSDITLLQIGEEMPAIDTPTFDDARGVDPICTLLPEPCPFHTQTLGEALSTGDRVALLIATPQFCQTDVCGPVVELLIEASADFPDIQIVHGEVYVSPFENVPGTPDSSLTEVISALNLDFEPSLYLVDEAGTVADVLHLAWDRTELRAVLENFAS
jgi:hypothetical protein